MRFHLSIPKNPHLKNESNQALSEKFQSDFQRVLALAAEINELMAFQIRLGIQDKSIRKEVGDPLQTALALWAMTSGLIQTATAMEGMIPKKNSPTKNEFIAQGLALAKAGLKNQEGLV